ncbi:MAG: dipeptidase, partial [Thermomicrobiales bacterium]
MSGAKIVVGSGGEDRRCTDQILLALPTGSGSEGMANVEWQAHLDDSEERHLEEVCALLRIPSVSALPAHRAEMRAAAEWVAARLRAVGVPKVELLGPESHPLVFGRWIVDPGAPVTMIYGHYDVQPPDPLDLWRTPPFAPTLRDGNLSARGAADDKGPIVAAIQAVEALVQAGGRPPLNLAFFFEGEEEIGSPSLAALVHAERERMACGVVLSADGVMFGVDDPSLTLSTKGMLKGEIAVRAAASDLHSGLFGASTPNALQVLGKILASLHTDEGAVAVPGFYARARALSDRERAEIAAVPFDDAAFLAETGAPALWGEPGYSVLERLWMRPTIDLNGLWGGFQGAGSKTVTPCAAHAKFTCRLVAGQDPAEILRLIREHVARVCPPWATAEVSGGEGSAFAFEIAGDHPALLAAGETIRELYGKEPLRIRLGGTLPVAEIFQRELGADMVFFAWEQADNNLHAPDEFVRLSDLAIARRAWCMLLTRLGSGGGG